MYDINLPNNFSIDDFADDWDDDEWPDEDDWDDDYVADEFNNK